MCKKMAHSAQLNIKVDPPFSVGFSVGCSLLAVGVPGFRFIFRAAGCPDLCRVSFRWIVFCRRGRCGVGSAVGVGLPVGRVGFRGLDFLV